MNGSEDGEFMPNHTTRRAAAAAAAVSLLTGAALARAAGNAPAAAPGTEDVVLPAGYVIEPVLTGLTYASGMTFGDDGTLYVAEAGHCYGQFWSDARIFGLSPGGRVRSVASDFRAPVMGITYRDNKLYVADRGRIVLVDLGTVHRERRLRPLVSDLPVVPNGQHFNSPVAFGPDGKMYWAVGAVTNSGVPGADDLIYGWLLDMPWMRDAPARDVTLAADPNYPNPDVLGPDLLKPAPGAAFLPFGTPARAGRVIPAHPRPTGAVYRADASGENVEVFAWGIRSPVGIGFGPDQRLYLTDHGIDDKGARPAGEVPDALWAVTQGAWYGWPDYAAGIALTDERFKPKFPLGRAPVPVMQNAPAPAQPAARFEPHASAMKFDWSRSDRFGFKGEMFLAEFGDGAPVTSGLRAIPHRGFRVVRVNTQNGAVEPFLTINNPGSAATRGPKRPIQVLFDRSGDNLYLLDFGVLSINVSTRRAGIDAPIRTGTLWRIHRQNAGATDAATPAAATDTSAAGTPRRAEGGRLVTWRTARGSVLLMRKELRAALAEARLAQSLAVWDLRQQRLRTSARERLEGISTLATVVLQRIDDPNALDDGTRSFLLDVRDWALRAEPLRLQGNDPMAGRIDRWIVRTRWDETDALYRGYAVPGRWERRVEADVRP